MAYVLTLGVALFALVVASNIGCAGSGARSFSSLLAQVVSENPSMSAEDRVCGPFELAPLIPDCPFDLVCFTSACEAHNLCYGTCGASKTDCDNQFHQDMILICNDSYTIEDQQ